MKELKNICNKMKSVITEPDKFFASVKKEKGLSEPVKFYAVVTGIPLLAIAILATAGFPLMAMMGLAMSNAVAAFLIFLWLLQIAGSFFSVGITHAAILLLGGKNGYANTYKAIAYGSMPAALFGIFPYIGLLALLYTLYLEMKGVSSLQRISSGRAAVAVLVVPLASVALAAIFSAALVSRMMI